MPGLDPEQLVFIDETWANTKMTRRYGRSRRGERLVMPVPHGHWKTTTFVAALRADGLIAPMVVDGAMNGDLFVAYVEQVLVPTLRPGDIVVMDNLAEPQAGRGAPAIEAAGCRLLYLPPYSPDLNPIELAFYLGRDLRLDRPVAIKVSLLRAGERSWTRSDWPRCTPRSPRRPGSGPT